MSKTKTLFTMALLVLLGSMGAAQAQEDTANFAEVKLFTTPAEYAREGGKNEMAGSILLSASDQAAIEVLEATITLHFSAPLAATIPSTTIPDDQVITIIGGTATVEGTAENEDNDDNGTIELSGISFRNDESNNLLIQGVALDVSGADGAITVTVEATPGPSDFIRIDGPSSDMVIGGIKVGVDPSATAVTVRTRGTGAGGKMVSLTLKESFKGAFMTGNMVTVDFSGIPEGATLDAMVTSNLVANAMAVPPVVVDMTTPYATVGPVKDGSVTVMLGGMDMYVPPNEDEPMPRDRPHPTSVTLGLTLTAIPPDDDEEMLFPLARSSIMARATFTDMQGGDDNFEDAFTEYVTVFNIRPAQCELLFPVVTVLEGYDTAISVTNPAYEDEMASGGLTFTFYGMGGVVEPYDTTEDPPAGKGLEDDGTLSPGGTYQVLAHEILAATGWGATFQGHVHLTADYTNCSGLGWVTDFTTVNQAYSAVVIDADTGEDNDGM